MKERLNKSWAWSIPPSLATWRKNQFSSRRSESSKYTGICTGFHTQGLRSWLIIQLWCLWYFSIWRAHKCKESTREMSWAKTTSHTIELLRTLSTSANYTPPTSRLSPSPSLQLPFPSKKPTTSKFQNLTHLLSTSMVSNNLTKFYFAAKSNHEKV